MHPSIRRLLVFGILTVVTLAVAPALAAQSLTSGSLRGAVLTLDGDPVGGVQVSLELADGRALAVVETSRDGGFSLPLLRPGLYRVLVEQVGFQPVRYLDVPVAAGQTTVLSARIERRPPPISEVTEVQFSGALGGAAMGPVVNRRELTTLDPRTEATDLSRGITEVDAPREGRDGFALSAAGLPVGASRLYVDGLPETMMRHPGVTEPVGSALFSRGALAQAQVVGVSGDAEWRGFPGPVLAAHTASGGNRVSFRPYAAVGSTSLGAQADDNPADSSAYTIQAGATLSGPIVTDTAQFALRFDYQSLRMPTAYPWANDATTRAGNQVSLRQALPEIGTDTYGAQLGRYAAPVVRSWEGFNGMGRLDWRIGTNQVVARFGFASFTEEQPQLGFELSNLSGVTLDGTDVSAGLTVTSGSAAYANEFRLGFTTTKRDWTGAAVPATSLVAEGVAFGGSAALPGNFERQGLDLSDAFQVTSGDHRFKLGASVRIDDYTQTYRYGSAGVYAFGSLDGFAGGDGTFFQTVTTGQQSANPRINDVGVFLQDAWAVSPEIQLLLGIRYDTQILPQNDIQANADWFRATGIANDSLPEDRKGWSPRAGFVWDVQNRGEWVLTGNGGFYQGRLDPALFAEAMLFDGSTTVRRGVGRFAFWPSLPDGSLAPSAGTRLTLFNPTYRNPRTFKAGVGINRVWPSGVTLRVEGGYYHTDFLLRRADLNRVASPVATTQEGRPVYGTLVKQGGMLVADPGSNRRFSDFDLVSGLSPTGYSDHQEVTVALERSVAAGLSFSLSYTYSKTEDNTIGLRSFDPADQLSPFPDGLAGADWTDGRSDFDVPHRAMAYVEYRSAGRTPVAVGARYRYRSGLPFTPGFRPGVDINGDGAGGNDPAYVDASLGTLPALLATADCAAAGANTFVARNACREQALNALDLRLEVTLPARFSDGSRLALVVDGFNLLTAETGIVDRALVLVDRNAPLGAGTAGRVNVPLVANPNFGQLLSRRAEPRMVRVGLRVEY